MYWQLSSSYSPLCLRWNYQKSRHFEPHSVAVESALKTAHLLICFPLRHHELKVMLMSAKSTHLASTVCICPDLTHVADCQWKLCNLVTPWPLIIRRVCTPLSSRRRSTWYGSARRHTLTELSWAGSLTVAVDLDWAVPMYQAARTSIGRLTVPKLVLGGRFAALRFVSHHTLAANHVYRYQLTCRIINMF